VRALPPLRPLVLAVKALLKEASLNEVFSGGISSYALMTLMAAHLQAEGAAPPYLSASVPAEAALASPGSGAGSEEAEQQQSDEDEDEDEDEWEEEEEAEEEEEEQEEGMATSSSSSSSAEEPASMEEGEAAPGDTQQQQNSSRASRRRARAAAAAAAADDDSDVDEQQQEPQLLHPQDVLQHLRDLVTLPASASEAPGWEAGGTWDYGVLLQGFFRRYGSLMDYVMEAVALSRGGVSPKPQPWQGRGQWKGSPALAVQDPQQHGRNITPYTHMRLSLLQQTFAWAEKALAAAADQYAPSFNGVAPPPQQQQQQQGREDLGVIGAGGRRAAHQLYQQQLQQGARAATWADVQADGQHRSQAATGQAAAAPQSWEAKQAAALHRQMPVLGEVVSLWAAVGKGPGADQLRGELRDAAMLMQERLDNKEVPKGVRKIRAKMALILKKRAAAGQRGKLRSAGASNGAAAGGFKKTKKQKKKDKQAKQQKKQKKQEKQAKKQARKQK
jgi:DNA polymerase sigma